MEIFRLNDSEIFALQRCGLFWVELIISSQKIDCGYGAILKEKCFIEIKDAMMWVKCISQIFKFFFV